MKILIGCAGIGGESEKWNDFDNEIIHVEIDPKIANVILKDLSHLNDETVVNLIDHVHAMGTCKLDEYSSFKARFIQGNLSPVESKDHYKVSLLRELLKKVSEMKSIRPVFATEVDGDWFVVPVDEKDEFNILEDATYKRYEDHNDYLDACEKFEDAFGKYRTGGDLNNIQLYAEI